MREMPWSGLDWTTYLFCLLHIPATVFVDLTPIYPDIALLRPLQWLRAFYLDTFADPLMGGKSNPGAWFSCFLWIEGLFQLPVCIALVLAYRRGQHNATWARMLIGLYAIQVATSTIASIAEIFAFRTITLRQKLTLLSMFWPYAVVPVYMGLGHLKRLLEEDSRNRHELTYLRVRKKQSRTILLTGANSGVGFGCVERILDQCRPALLCKDLKLVLILTVRSKAKADSILVRLKQDIAAFGESLYIQFEMLDLLSLESAEALCKRLQGQQIDTCIFNAGMSELERFDFTQFVRQLVTAPIAALSTPEYNIQRVGSRTKDGFGVAFQANVLGHAFLYARLSDAVGTVVWMSSLEATSKAFVSSDPEALTHAHGYESSKRLIDLLYSTWLKDQGHFLVHPGFCATNIISSVIPSFLPVGLIQAAWRITFRLLMLFGSQFHVATAYNGAYAASTMATAFLLHDEAQTQRHVGKKMGSACNSFNQPYLAFTRMDPISPNEQATAAQVKTWVESLARYEKEYPTLKAAVKALADRR